MLTPAGCSVVGLSAVLAVETGTAAAGGPPAREPASSATGGAAFPASAFLSGAGVAERERVRGPDLPGGKGTAGGFFRP